MSQTAQPLPDPDSGQPLSNAGRAIAESDIGEGLDRLNLTQLRNRFMSLNMQRMQRLQHSLLANQRVFIDLLPLLFHINHPALPGYCGTDTPTGIRNFKLSSQQIKSARKLSSSFALQRELNPELNIRGLYLMGSCSSVTHNGRSDLDIWVCPASGLSELQLDALRRKCQLINEWAQSMRLETHFFIMDAEAFKQGERSEMTEEDCGTTQHYLLLDEFYRTSIVVAGCTPLWWYIPASFENDYDNYAQTLLQKRYLEEFNCIDFGTPGQLPASEFVSAGVWQLYKGIASPEKALLKLMLLEVYASEHPHTSNLSTAFKTQLYKAEPSDNELDPYLQIYRRIESYLKARKEPSRLELLRRCFYIKAGIALSKLPEEALESTDPEEFIKNQLSSPQYWKRAFMHKLVAEWDWKRSQLLELDNRQDWTFAQCKAEQNRLTKELVRSYQLLGSLAKSDTTRLSNSVSESHASNNSRLLNILGRQLYAAFEHKPNKLQQLTTSVVKSLIQPSVTVSVSNTDQGPEGPDSSQQCVWALHDDNSTSGQQALKQAADPAQLLVWGIVNGLIGEQTRFKLDGNTDLSEYELKQLTGSLLGLLPVRNRACNTEQGKALFSKPAYVEQCVVIANCGLDPLKMYKEEGVWHLTDRNDPLSYTNMQENLVVSLTLIEINSWGEVYCHSYTGSNAIDQFLKHYFAYAETQPQLPDRRFLCASPTRPDAIRLRLNTLTDDIESCFAEDITLSHQKSHGAGDRVSPAATAKLYVYESASGFHVLHWSAEGLCVSVQKTEEKLLNCLGNGENIGKLVLDPVALQSHPLCAISRTLEARSNSAVKRSGACIFYEVVESATGSIANVYLCDSEGSLAYVELPYESMRSLIMPIRTFIAQSELRRANSKASAAVASQPASSHPSAEVACYVLQESFGEYSARQLPTESDISANLLPIKATGSINERLEIAWTIACDGQLYEQALIGDAIYLEVAKAIMQCREKNSANYRCYITDIDVENDSHRRKSLARDFNYKNILEQKLNAAYETLLR